jgi:hypothetical protein
MRVLVACEFSGTVRDAFIKRGHDAWSCDLLPTENTGPHRHGNVLEILEMDWDLMIAHPPCTYLTISANKWYKPEFAERFPTRYQDRYKSIVFFMQLMMANIPKIAVENPIGIMSSCYRKPDQVIQPWMFGHGETKATCLWLKGLPKLKPTNIVDGREQRLYKLPPSKDRWKERSKTYQGIADAMADQWGLIEAERKG